MRIAMITVFLGVLAGCGDPSSNGSSGSGGSGGAGGAGGGNASSSTASGHSPSGCPPTAPAMDEQCSVTGLRCTYGDSPRPDCRTLADCIQGKFMVAVPKCTEPPAGACPAQPPMNGATCASDGAVCTYADGTICGCSACNGGPCMPPPPAWGCGTPAADCPKITPNAGTACSQEGQSCTYGLPCGLSGETTTCTNGAWVWSDELCPL